MMTMVASARPDAGEIIVRASVAITVLMSSGVENHFALDRPLADKRVAG
jgi:hypothetical protein